MVCLTNLMLLLSVLPETQRNLYLWHQKTKTKLYLISYVNVAWRHLNKIIHNLIQLIKNKHICCVHYIASPYLL